ncbi:MAG: hypothetical protein KF809_16675 [Chloroflexi bacterium]|nr:hypothetical protein [Chloroflexota bacterium]
MLQRLIGVTIGAAVTFVLLLLFYGGVSVTNGVATTDWRIVSDSGTAFLVAAALGAVASFFWPIVIGWWLVRRTRSRRQTAVEAEVQRQLAEQQRNSGPRT